MTRDELDKLWQQALQTSVAAGEEFIRYHFAELVAAEERDKHDTGTHTCGNRCQRYACVAVREAVLAEREACAKSVEPNAEHRRDASWGYIGGVEGVELLDAAAAAIRARGEP
jgi:hypothetical protein